MSVFAWGFYLQPSSFQSFWARVLGSLLRRIKLRARVVETNIAYAYPTATEQERERLFRAAYRHIGELVLEMVLLFGPFRKYAMAHADVRGVEHWQEAKAKGKGVLFLSSHLGNWELMAASGALIHGIDILLVTKQLKPKWLHHAVEKSRLRCKVGAAYEPKTLKTVLHHLHRNGTVGFVLDQYTGPPVGVRVHFFGVPVGTSTALATLAKRTGATVLPVTNYRTPEGKTIVEIKSPIPWHSNANSEFELAENTQAYVAALERHIREHPEQWLWTHRRFKGDLRPLREGEWTKGRRDNRQT